MGALACASIGLARPAAEPQPAGAASYLRAPAPRTTQPWFLLSAAVALLAALSGCGAGAPTSRTVATPPAVPPLYAETVAILPPAYDNPLNLSIRNTATGEESAALRASPPYQSIGFVAGTGKPNWWIVGAQRWHPVKYDNSAQPAKLYLATYNVTDVDGQPLSDPFLTPLPVAPIPASQPAHQRQRRPLRHPSACRGHRVPRR